MNKDIVKGIIVLTLLSTLIWSLNLNFNPTIQLSWLEAFGSISLIFMIGATFLTKQK